MNTKITKALVAGGLALAGVLAAPIAANAAAYPPGGNVITVAGTATITGDAVPGGTVTIHFRAGLFRAGHQLSIYFFSAGTVPTSATPAEFLAASAGPVTNVSAASDGSATFSTTLPSDASAPITVEATDGVTTAAVTIPISTAVAAAGTGAAGSASLPITGTDVSYATLWGAAGAVALGAGALGARSLRVGRRPARHAAHRA